MSNKEEHSPAQEEADNRNKVFSCCICLDTPCDPVLTPCGHLFCWSCLVNWLDSNHDDCPVCRGHVTRENVTPIYGADGASEDPRKKESTPKRPQAHYEESDHTRQNRNQQNFFNMFNGLGTGFPGFMNFNFNGGTFMIGGGSPFFLLFNIITMVGNMIMNWWNRRQTNQNNQQPNESSSNTSSEAVVTNDTMYIIVTVVALLLISFFF